MIYELKKTRNYYTVSPKQLKKVICFLITNFRGLLVPQSDCRKNRNILKHQKLLEVLKRVVT